MLGTTTISGGLLAAIIFPCLLVGALLGAGIFWILRKRHARDDSLHQPEINGPGLAAISQANLVSHQPSWERPPTAPPRTTAPLSHGFPRVYPGQAETGDTKVISLPGPALMHDVPLRDLSADTQYLEPDCPGIGIVGGPETIRSWVAVRGRGAGVNQCSWGRFNIMYNPSPDEDGVNGGIFLHDVSKDDMEKWRESGKTVLIEGKDPVRDESWSKNWARSLTSPFEDILADIEKRRIQPKEWEWKKSPQGRSKRLYRGSFI